MSFGHAEVIMSPSTVIAVEEEWMVFDVFDVGYFGVSEHPEE